jgi:hypothetical protein
VFDPAKAVVAVMDFVRATHQIAQTTLRSVLGQSDLDELLSQREEINLRLQQIIDEQTEPWGIKVGIVEVKDVELPQSMQRAMARQAEAEREKRAKIIHASGEFEASKMLTRAARIIGSEPATIQLRYLQTLTEIASERNSTIIFPVPIELLSMIPHVMGGSSNGAGGTGGGKVDIGALDTDMDTDVDLLPDEPVQGSLPQPIAGSEAEVEEARPKASALHTMNEENLEEMREEHAKFIAGNISANPTKDEGPKTNEG